ncbi:MAG: prephenate dehydrogenase/arogenate dehydrogenase family protein [Phycisphaerales bacterium]|nr:prephenate dehydrogenase/arogenate dehydrogenase family protein [Phycisphaerales bacterium]
MEIPRVGLLGFGAFGRLAAQHLAPHCDLLVHDPVADRADIRSVGASPCSCDEAATCDVCVLAVPMQAMETVCRQLAPHMGERTLVADVGSIKTGPVQTMLRTLPPRVELLGTHPLFGPQTVGEVGLPGQTIALCPVRLSDERLRQAREFLGNTLGLHVIETTPDEHDRQMALVQVVTHLVGHAASEMNLPELPLATLAYKRLLQMKHNVERDSEELFEAIQTLNPYAADVRRRFVEAVCSLNDRVNRA